jgi:UDP-2,3-diacylglucosamine hydrolase
VHLTGAARTLFISDLHLEESRPRVAALFERFLEEKVPGASALYILGDLFEAWVGDDGLALPFPRRIAAAIARAADSTPVRFMRGNRDFLVGERFAREAGVRLLPDSVVIDLHGTPALLVHGDTLCLGDTDYQAFRRQVRDPGWQAALLARPLDERLKLASEMRAESEVAKEGKAAEIMDVTPAAVEQAFLEAGVRLLIHGHTHRPARHLHLVAGTERVRWVLADWPESGSYLEASASGLRAIDYR